MCETEEKLVQYHLCLLSVEIGKLENWTKNSSNQLDKKRKWCNFIFMTCKINCCTFVHYVGGKCAKSLNFSDVDIILNFSEA